MENSVILYMIGFMVTVMVVVQVVSLALFRTPTVLIRFHINLVIVCVSAIKIFLRIIKIPIEITKQSRWAGRVINVTSA